MRTQCESMRSASRISRARARAKHTPARRPTVVRRPPLVVRPVPFRLSPFAFRLSPFAFRLSPRVYFASHEPLRRCRMRYTYEPDVEAFREEVKQFIKDNLPPEEERLQRGYEGGFKTNQEEYDYTM